MKVYRDSAQKYQAEIDRLEKTLKELSVLRLITFVISAVVIVLLANERLAIPTFIAASLFVISFGALVKRYNTVDDLKKHKTFLKEINEGEILRQENKLSDFPTGETYTNPRHHYFSDLDIFGQHSLFQLINRTTTGSGEALLAECLFAPAVKDTILERQEAVKELSPKLDWRQEFQARGMRFTHSKVDHEHLLRTVEKPAQLLPHVTRYLACCILLSLLSTSALLYFLNNLGSLLSANAMSDTESLKGLYVSLVPLSITMLVNALILRTVQPIAREMTEKLSNDLKVLACYQSLINSVTSEKFQSKKLQYLQGALRASNFAAENEIKKLSNILSVFQLRGRKGEFNNFFYSYFNALWFLDVYIIILTEKWKNKNGSRVGVWMSAISEVEVLNSLAGFHYSNPTFAFPEINDDPYCIQFKMLGHPLIGAKKRVCNDFSLNGRGEIAMITGSNMAGKSTFLRAVGINVVLALMGAPCCAKYASVSDLKIFTSMRTQDSLEEGVSSFYAELKRIGQLLKLIESGQPVFFLLDEMFKGTNSKDRHKGGFSLIIQLKELNAFGMISTHDLDLAALAETNKIATNHSFNSSIREGEMTFDYVITEGLCSDFNASELMRRSGIKVLPEV